MKGVTYLGVKKGVEFLDERKRWYHRWKLLGGLFVGLLLSSLLWTSGVTSASPSSPEISIHELDLSRTVLSIGTMTLEVTRQGDVYQFTYRQAGVVHEVSIIDQAGSLAYSLDDGPWTPLSLHAKSVPALRSPDGLPSASGSESASLFAHRHWWDGVRFVKGYPLVYTHPDRDFYQIFPKHDWKVFGFRLLHYQFGTASVGLLANLGPLPLGAAIGAAIGSVLAPGIGTLVGAIAGTIVGGILTYAYNAAFVDEAGTIWWWINRSLFTGLKNIPWWVWWCGPCMQAYIAANIDYLRIGGWTGYNELGVWGP